MAPVAPTVSAPMVIVIIIIIIVSSSSSSSSNSIIGPYVMWQRACVRNEIASVSVDNERQRPPAALPRRTPQSSRRKQSQRREIIPAPTTDVGRQQLTDMMSFPVALLEGNRIAVGVRRRIILYRSLRTTWWHDMRKFSAHLQARRNASLSK